MDIRICYGLDGRSSSKTTHLGGKQQQRPYNSGSASASLGRSRKSVKWRGIWMGFLKEKRRHRHVDKFQVPSYNSYTYSQNFDQGVAWDEPENISRSFSVKFTNPAASSRGYGKKTSERTPIEVEAKGAYDKERDMFGYV